MVIDIIIDHKQGYQNRVLTHKIVQFYESKHIKHAELGLKLENQ
jgi:hypothetical protein